MIHRKTRTHQTGASNLNKTVMPRIDDSPIQARHSVDSATAAKRVGDILSKRINTSMTPMKQSEYFYEESGRTLKMKPQISFPRTSQLEEKDKRKLAFTGESFLVYDKNFRKYREQDSGEAFSPKLLSKKEKEQLIKDKKQEHGTAIQETQLVGYDKFSADTLKNNVNLEKVREAKRILRRRYGNRTQLQKIYSAWDEDNKGVIGLENVYNMSKKLGLNLNVDEARVLLASANKSGTGQLSLDEFLDLIYNKDDALNVNLDNLSKGLDENYLLKRDELYKEGEQGVIKKLESDAKKMRENKRINQVNLVLKNKLGQIATAFLKSDPHNAGYVNYEKFEEGIMHVGINENIISSADIKVLAEKYKHKDHHTIDYKAFIEGLKNFNVQFDEMYTEYKQSNKKMDTSQVAKTVPTEGNFDIVDCRNIPFNTMINYLEKRGKVNTAIKRFFPQKEEFQGYLSKCLNISKEKINEHPISKTGVKDMINTLFSNFDDSVLKKRDFEGFVSSFLYNKHGFTNIQDLCHGIYDANNGEYFDNIIYKKSGLPPHSKIAGLTDSTAKFDPVNTESPDATQLKGWRFSSNGNSTKSLNVTGQMDKELKGILEKVDNRLFVGTKKNYDVYKQFDVDKDGYISHNDFKSKIQEFAILQKDEIPKLIRYLDPENKGYVNFNEFNAKIRPNMTQQDELGQSTVLPFVTPSKKFNQKEVSNFEDYKKRTEEFTKAYEYSHTEYRDQTRFGASPQWVNTFLNFQPSSNSGMFQSEERRFDRDHLHRTRFQREDQDKRQSTSVGRVEAIRNTRENFQKNLDLATTKLENRIESNLQSKSLQKTLFERRAKLKNAFAF